MNSKVRCEAVINETCSYNLYLLRIMACGMVLIGHFFGTFQYGVLANEEMFPFIQSVGVIFFFFLSGYLSYFSLQRYDMKTYIINRFVRIYSFYFPALVLIWIIDSVNIFLFPGTYAFYHSFNALCFIKNIFQFPIWGIGGGSVISGVINYQYGTGAPLWTLFIEWWLYLLTASIFYSIKSNRFCSVLFLSLLMTFFTLIGINGQFCIIVYLVGLFLAYFESFYNAKQNNIMAIISFLLLIVLCMIYKNAYCIQVISAVCVYCFFFKETDHILTRKKQRLVKKFSEATFPIYLIHYSCLMLVFSINRAYNLNMLQTFVLYLVGVAVLSIVLYMLKAILNSVTGLCVKHFR